ncbi:glycosyltransferase [Pantoea sp. USHLN256]|uniref:glycosyltransferase n=1 Tax=Pantoea sp. USHLN256 TaxID=3081293 RepID=UPI003016C272
MNEYDLIIITNVPAFYKVNLFEEISKKIKIKVFFISKSSKIRNDDFYNYNMKFDHEFLSEACYEERNALKVFFKVWREIRKIRYKRILFPGWEIKELFFISLLTELKKNAVAIESSINESNVKGSVGLLKRIYLNRMSYAYPSGFLQNEILKSMSFRGQVFYTHGVGIANKVFPRKGICKDNLVHKLNYVYVGRLSEEKNLHLLVEVFNELNLPLTIVGDGPQEKELKKIAKGNINFKGYIHNNKLRTLLDECDVFVLPSISEPWGLVVEEALSAGLPVIVSDRVGCHKDLINNKNGIVFKSHDAKDLKFAISKMEEDYPKLRNGVFEHNVENNSAIQINSYVDSLKNI